MEQLHPCNDVEETAARTLLRSKVLSLVDPATIAEGSKEVDAFPDGSLDRTSEEPPTA